MTLTEEESAQCGRFEAAYLRSQTPVMLAIERQVCGCDYGGNSWTSRREAEHMSEVLELGPGRSLLDLGAGSGWPGLYLARISGCAVTLLDLPPAGLKIAAERAGRDGLSERASVICGNAGALPFRDASFDAISHSDLLCCLVEKRTVLEECRSVIKPRGRMAFTVIYIAPGLPAADHARAAANGPDFIETDTDYPTLLAETGWRVVERMDITETYTGHVRRQLDADLARRDDLEALIGAGVLAERLENWRSKLAILGDGLLRRDRFVAEPATMP